jgi:hypothetical protein
MTESRIRCWVNRVLSREDVETGALLTQLKAVNHDPALSWTRLNQNATSNLKSQNIERTTMSLNGLPNEVLLEVIKYLHPTPGPQFEKAHWGLLAESESSDICHLAVS